MKNCHSGTTFPIAFLVLSLVTGSSPAVFGASATVSIRGDSLPDLPVPEGLTGAFAGASGDSLLIAGGVSYIGGNPVWRDKIYRLDDPQSGWLEIGSLTRATGFGFSCRWNEFLICVGGRDQDRHYQTVTFLKWQADQLETTEGPPLPFPLIDPIGVRLNDTLYVAGKSVANGTFEANRFLSLALSSDLASTGWEELDAWPGPEQFLVTIAAINEKVLLIVSSHRVFEPGSAETRNVQMDAFLFDTDPKNMNWQPVSEPPPPLSAVARPGVQIGSDDVIFPPGIDIDDTPNDSELRVTPANAFWRYNVVIDQWIEETNYYHGSVERPAATAASPPPFASQVVPWKNDLLMLGGFSDPLNTAATVTGLSFAETKTTFGPLNWLVLALYLSGVAAIGLICSRRGQGTEGFFLANRRIPWWAAGLSIFSTMLSAITFLAIPSKAYATNWTLLVNNLMILAVAPLIAWVYLPIFRKTRITTIYQFLGARFDRSIQRFSSASFILFQLGRMGVVLLLPGLALAAVTGIDLYLCILLMGVLATLYTVAGGIEAVIWTDVLQTVVLLGGALIALAVMASKTDQGFIGLLNAGVEADKFHWINWNADLFTDSLLVMLIGGFFTNALIPYSSDQTVVQRYLTTRNETEARRSLWLGAAMTLPATLLFLMLGTGLFAFYQSHPELLAPLKNPDQIFAWFIADQMPAGLGGLVIAGIFAASMSSLDSSMHSIATTITQDWRNANKLKEARWITAIAGIFGTASALVLASMEIKFLWDFFLGLIGLLGGTLAGIMAVGVFLKSAKSYHLWAGIMFSIALVWCIRFQTDFHSLLAGFFALFGVVGVVALLIVFDQSNTSKRNPGAVD